MSHRKNPIPTPVRPRDGPITGGVSPAGEGRGQSCPSAVLLVLRRAFDLIEIATSHRSS